MSVGTPRKKTGRGYERRLDAGPLQPMIGSFDLHLRAERKSPKTIRTYVEAAQWMAASYLLPAGVADWAEVRARHVQSACGIACSYQVCHWPVVSPATSRMADRHGSKDGHPSRNCGRWPPSGPRQA